MTVILEITVLHLSAFFSKLNNMTDIDKRGSEELNFKNFKLKLKLNSISLHS